MAKQIHFTMKALRALRPRSRDYYVKDDLTRGLVLCVTSGGAKTFYLNRRVQGKARRLLLGRLEEIKLGAAKDLCDEWNPKISRGEDPTIERERSGLTLGKMFSKFIERHGKPHKKTWREDEKVFGRYLRPWKHRLITDITKGDVAGLHVKIGKKHGHYAANRVLALISTIFSKADAWDLFTGRNPAKGIQRFRETSRDRFLDADELRRLFDAMDSEDALFNDFFRICLFTGARSGNVRAMRWEDVDLGAACWTIPDTKSSRPQLVPLVAKAVEILKERQSFAAGEWVFPGRFTGTHLQEPKSAWRRICTRANLEDVRIHDLRRTLGSWMAGRGESLPMIGRTLGHSSPQSTQVYSRVHVDPAREAMAGAIEAMTKPTPD